MLVDRGCHNKMSLAGWLKQQNVIFTQIWKLGSPISRCWYIQFLVRVLFLAPNGLLLAVLSHGGEERGGGDTELSVSLLRRTLIPSDHGSTFITLFDLNCFRTPNAVQIRASTYEFWDDTIQSVAFCPWTPKFISLSHAKHIRFIPTARKVLSHSSVHSQV